MSDASAAGAAPAPDAGAPDAAGATATAAPSEVILAAAPSAGHGEEEKKAGSAVSAASSWSAAASASAASAPSSSSSSSFSANHPELLRAQALRAPTDARWGGGLQAAQAGDRVAGLCDGACSFLGYCTVVFFAGVFVPICLLLPIALVPIAFGDAPSGPRFVALVAVAGALLLLALIYCCVTFRTLLSRGLPCNLPPAPPFCSSLSGAQQPVVVRPRRVYVVANLTSGTLLGAAILRDVVQPMCAEKGVETIVLATKYGGHARDYGLLVPLEGVDAALVVGGDGSLCEFVNGMLARADGRKVPVGLLPGGSGNSVSADIGTWSAREAMRRILEGGQTHWVDANRVRDEAGLDVYSLNEASVGLVGEVAYTAEVCRCLGPGRYDVCGMWGLAKGLRESVRLRYVDPAGAVVRGGGRMVTAFVMNTQFFGKGLRAAPRARVDDGLADLLFVDTSRAELLALFNMLPSGAHAGDPIVQYQQVRDAWIEVLPDGADALAAGEGEEAEEEEEKKAYLEAGQLAAALLAQPAASPASSSATASAAAGSAPRWKHKGIVNIDGEVFPYDGTLRITVERAAFQLFIQADTPSVDPTKEKVIVK